MTVVPRAPRAAPDDGLGATLDDVRELQDATTEGEAAWASGIARVDRENGPSAVNLAHYWAVRQHDLRGLQQRLAAFGLSSLGRCEPHVLASLDAIVAAATALCGLPAGPVPHDRGGPSDTGHAGPRRHTGVMLVDRGGGPEPAPGPGHTHGDRPGRVVDAPADHRLDPPPRRPGLATPVHRRGGRARRCPRLEHEDHLRRDRTLLHRGHGRGVPVGDLPALPRFVTLHRGDTLVLTRDCAPAPVATQGPAHIGCTLPDVFGHVLPGQPIHLDDGKMSGVVVAADEEQITLRITRASAGGSRLRAAKGINLPDTALPMAALTATDRQNLAFVAEHADLVEMSFVRRPEDVEDLLAAVDGLGIPELGVVVKLETVQGFANLPAILFALMRRPHTGVMIARGDLAVEAGYERTAELQEEILWLCEAAHLPVIWATQVLDQLARKGQPSRAEITDAAMGERAECVMLNKGPHIVDAVDALDDVLHRMTDHHDKNNTLLRPLRSWRLSTSESHSADESDGS